MGKEFEEEELEIEIEAELDEDTIMESVGEIVVDDEIDIEPEMDFDIDVEAEIDIEPEMEFDIDLGDEIDLDTSGLDEGFMLEDHNDVSFIEEDILGSDEVIIDLGSRGSLAIGTAQPSGDTLLIELDDVEIEVESDEPRYELIATPAETALALYPHREDESFLVEQSNREIHDSLYDVKGLRDATAKRLREYLDSPMFNVLPKSAKFLSVSYRNQQDFRSMLIADFMNHLALPSEYTEEHIIKKVLGAYKEERLPELSSIEEQKLINAIHKFVVFGDFIYSETQKQIDAISYKSENRILQCPEVVGNFTYVCKCGAEYPMPEGRPTLTFLIREYSKNPMVTLMNHKIPCETCKVHLALPISLAQVLEVEMQEYVKRIKATYEQPRIYRPKIEDLMSMIPTDVKDLFQLEGDTIVESKVTTASSYSTAFTNYKKLINMWMDSVTSEKKLEQVMEKYSESTDLAPIVKQLTYINFGVVTDLYAYQYAKTLLHYLEGFSCFALTSERVAFYKLCDIEGYNKKPFPVDYANRWIKKNAAYLASLINLYSGDTTMEDLNILPEYLDAINYVIGIHLLSKEENLYPKGDLAKWVKDPSKENKLLKKLYKNLKTPAEHMLASSHRELITEKVVYGQECWSDTYTFIRTIVSPLRRSPELSDNIKELANKAIRTTQEEFYGMEIPKKLMVKPTPMFNEFMQVFEQFGYKLFTGPIVDELTKNIAKGIVLCKEGKVLNKVVKYEKEPVTDISTVLISESEPQDLNKILLELIIQVADLPGELSQKRDEIGYKDILDNLEDYKEDLVTNEEFMEKYGEVILCS